MRLKSLKLAGFKSFVDPIEIDFPGIMCGIVGPNGCGKSNIIDAIKWVKGELSAKSLRSESLQDVIFNGSDSRKPVSHCSVELSFDNSENFLGGEYLKFDEVSVKREMGRDGQSTYFINNAVARRRDVQDLFLGTGLGGNSYAIIEQGIISSLVGAKPEELRSYVEEAAGISKYKERKRETESRIRRTSENISRLKDLEDEVKRSIRRLKAEANLTSRYKKLRTKEQEFQKFIVNDDLKALLNSMNESQKENDSIDKDLEKIDGDRLNFVAKRDVVKTKLMEGLIELEEEQRNFFEAGAKISLIEEKERTVESVVTGASRTRGRRLARAARRFVPRGYRGVVLRPSASERGDTGHVEESERVDGEETRLVAAFDHVAVESVDGEATVRVRVGVLELEFSCLLYTSPSPRDLSTSRMPSSA